MSVVIVRPISWTNFWALANYIDAIGTGQGSARPDLDHRDLDRDWKTLSLNDETETENVESQWRDRYRDWIYPSLNDETDTKTENVWVSMTRPRQRLKKSESQWRDRDLKCLSLNDETETETKNG